MFFNDEDEIEKVCLEAQKLAMAGKHLEAFEIVMSIPDIPEWEWASCDKVEALIAIGRCFTQAESELLRSALFAPENALQIFKAKDHLKANQLAVVGDLWRKLDEPEKATIFHEKSIKTIINSINYHYFGRTIDIDSIKILPSIIEDLIASGQKTIAERYVKRIASKHWRRKFVKFVANPAGGIQIFQSRKVEGAEEERTGFPR